MNVSSPEPMPSPGPWESAPTPALAPTDPLPPDAMSGALSVPVPAAPFALATPALPEEQQAALATLFGDRSPRGTAVRAGAGLLAMLPFAVSAGYGSHAELLRLAGAMLGVPVALALIALVGLSASTIGVSLLSRPLAPRDAADIGARGLLRAGLVLLGLTPVTALWVASYAGEASLLVPSLAWGIAGILGTIVINGRFARTVHPDGHLAPGTVTVLTLLTVFTLVLGARLWFSLLDVFSVVPGVGGGS